MLQDKVPYYFLIESLLRQKILSGQLQPGERLPTEVELASQFGVNRVTIRTALANLEAENLIIRRRGKGTFVNNNIPLRTQLIVTGDAQSFVEHTRQYKTRPLGIEKRRVSETRIAREVESFFGLSNKDTIHVVRRVRLFKRTPVIFTENFVLQDTAKHLTIKELSEEPLVEILKRNMKLRLGKTEAYLECVPADSDVAELLHSHIFAPLFLLRAYIWFPTGEPLEIATNFMRPDFFKYRIKTEHDTE